MGTPSSDNQRSYFASKYLVADGGAIAEQTADAGGTTKSIIDAALTQADDYWNGAIGWFDGDTTTVVLRGQPFHIKDFTSSTDTLTLARSLPAAPVEGDTYRLVLGGNYRSDTEVFGLSIDGSQPELISTVGSNITGLTITKASGDLNTGALTAFYDFSLDLLFIKVGSDDYGVGLDVSGDVSDGIVFDDTNNAWIQVDVVSGSLPGTDQTDTYTLAKPERTFVPDYESYETTVDGDGYTRYRLEVVKNNDSADSMESLQCYSEKPSGTDTTIASGILTTDAGSFVATDASDFPLRGFWVEDTTVDDCRYVKYRSGNTLYIQGVEWAILSFDAGSTEIAKGDSIEDETSGATAVVDQIAVTSGTWGGNDAAGTMTLKAVTGTFGDDNNIQVSSSTYAVANGDSALGMRGYTASAWSSTDSIRVMPDVDLGKDAPSTNQFESPATIYTAPDGVSFDNYPDSNEALPITDLSVGGIYGIWRREWIVSDSRGRDDAEDSINYFWG